jgi:hypothetical protein
MPSRDNFPQANELQLAILQHSVTANALVSGVSFARNLNISKALDNIQSQGMPADQWEYEVRRWETIGWTAYQIFLTDHATGAGSRDPDADPYLKQPTTAGEKQFCKVQKAKKPGGFV